MFCCICGIGPLHNTACMVPSLPINPLDLFLMIMCVDCATIIMRRRLATTTPDERAEYQRLLTELEALTPQIHRDVRDMLGGE